MDVTLTYDDVLVAGAAIVGLAGLWFAGSRRWWAWSLGVVAQILFFVHFALIQQSQFFLNNILYAIVYLRNFALARRNKKVDDFYRDHKDMIDKEAKGES